MTHTPHTTQPPHAHYRSRPRAAPCPRRCKPTPSRATPARWRRSLEGATGGAKSTARTSSCGDLAPKGWDAAFAVSWCAPDGRPLNKHAVNALLTRMPIDQKLSVMFIVYNLQQHLPCEWGLCKSPIYQVCTTQTKIISEEKP